MALVLDSGEYLTGTGFDPGITTEFTVAAYFKAADTTGWKAIVNMLLTGEPTISHILLAANGTGYDHWHYPQSGAVRSDASGTVSTSAWQLVILNYKQGAPETKSYLGGTNQRTFTNDVGSFRDLIDRIRIGMTDYSSIGTVTNNGKIAHVSVWDKQLTPTEITDLYSGGAGGIGKNPQDVASANLKFYAPLTSDATVTVGGISLSATGSVSYDADNPSVAAAGGGGINGTGSGSLDSLDLITPTGTGTGTTTGSVNGIGTGAFAASSLIAVTASGSGTVAGLGTITTPALKNNTGTVFASITGWTVHIYNASTGAYVVTVTGLVTNTSGVLSISSSSIVAGTTYTYEPVHTTYGRRLPTAVAV